MMPQELNVISEEKRSLLLGISSASETQQNYHLKALKTLL